MSDEDFSSTEMDVVSRASKAEAADQYTFNFFHKHEYSLSDLPPFEQIDRCSEETRGFVIEAYKKEQDFRHNMIQKEQDYVFAEVRNKGRASERQQNVGAITGCVIVVATLVWSADLIKDGHTAVGLAPLLAGIAAMVGAVVWGKTHASPEKEETSPTDKD